MAAQRTFYGYNDMADAKALLESIARSFGYIYGREHHVRVNTISQSPTMTTAGSGVKGMDKLFDFANRMSCLLYTSLPMCLPFLSRICCREMLRVYSLLLLPASRVLQLL